MRNRTRVTLCIVATIGAMGLITSHVQSQDKKKSPQASKPESQAQGGQNMPDPAKMAEMMAKWEKTTKPGAHHQALEAFVGEWNTITKVWMGGPGAPPVESTGTSSFKWVLGGRYVQQIFSGTMMGKPYEGIGHTGYDNYKNMYVFSWIQNQSTEMLTGMGMADPSKKVFTFYGQMDEAMLDVFGRTVKYVSKIINEDKHVFEIIDLHAGDDYKVIEIVYTRKS